MEEQPGMSDIDAYKLELRKNTEALEKNESDIVQAEKEVQKHLDDEHCSYYKNEMQQLRDERKQLREERKQIREQVLIKERQSLIPTGMYLSNNNCTRNNLVYIRISIGVPRPTQDRMNFSHFRRLVSRSPSSSSVPRYCYTLPLW